MFANKTLSAALLQLTLQVMRAGHMGQNVHLGPFQVSRIREWSDSICIRRDCVRLIILTRPSDGTPVCRSGCAHSVHMSVYK